MTDDNPTRDGIDRSDEPTYYVRCPHACDYATTKPQSAAFAHQKRHGCPECGRTVGVAPLSAADDDLRRRAEADAGPTVTEARI